jgi:hypothetical protein
MMAAFAVGLALWGVESRAQQGGYPMVPGGYPMMPGYAMPAAYMGPATGGPMGPQGPAPGPAPAAGSYCPTEGCGDRCSHRCRIDGWSIYGEYLFIRPRSAEVPYTVPVNGPIIEGELLTERGPVALLDPDYHSAYRFGFARALDECTNIGASYTAFESQTTGVTDNSAFPLSPMLMDPSTINGIGTVVRADASYDLNYQFADINYRWTFAGNCCWSADLLVGARYGRLEQLVTANYQATDLHRVNSAIEFDGAGPKIGLAGERHSCRNGFLVYGRTEASFLAGEFTARYLQRDITQGSVPPTVDTAWQAGRVVPVLEFELGAGWVSPNGLVRLTAGYMVSAWYNVVKTTDWVAAVQSDNFNHLDGTMTFDGLVGRAEVRF